MTSIAYPSGSTYPGSGSYPGSVGSPDEGVSLAWIPDLREVAVHIRSRTVERSTNRFSGTFTAHTRPSDSETEEVIGFAAEDVAADVGDLSDARISATGQKAIRSLIALRAAMIIERSYYPEQVGFNKSAYPGLERDWERRLPKVVDAIAEDIAGEIEPTPDSGSDGSGSGVHILERDLSVPQGANVLTRSGHWARTPMETDHSTFPDQPGAVDWTTRF